ncbi:hypothetical protein [Terribacillus saccharophilus]|uniref:hypothetical protein n=1 Tax=Terribacillus saccharophilus TaxID=361277 RepID=UPI003982889B
MRTILFVFKVGRTIVGRCGCLIMAAADKEQEYKNNDSVMSVHMIEPSVMW